ncbi:hypothetical protein CCACVL1_13559 [Corchorus capsularis]|uniref:Uncharacterized protein n=1 Tax=Corchorus capsularis TaxID=210143 RepID=A0A1R3IAG8_COCAP|nr:hypothetical protein CCACVL1_13559 [Corchorus capsularis]
MAFAIYSSKAKALSGEVKAIIGR